MACSIEIAERGPGEPAGGALLYHLADPFIHPPDQETGARLGDFMTREQLFLSQHGLIERLTAWVASRRGLRGADAEDFASTVTLRLIENDYEILGRFEGRSSLKTYLTAVVNRLYADFQNERFGKWRSSAMARRRGPLAIRLERLLYRDGLSFGEACGVLQTSVGVGATRDELYALSLELPRRAGRAAGALPQPPAAPADPGPTAVEAAERQALADRTFAILRRSLRRLPARDRVLLRLHLETGLTMAEAARALGERQKAAYRRKETILAALRTELEAQGIRERDVHELLSTLDWQAALDAGPAAGGSALEVGEP
jgi:RNA polymerase sigma factor (sigma-70 family)